MRHVIREQFRRFMFWAKWHLWIPLARVVGQMRSARQVLSVWPDQPVELGPKIVLFMHFDGQGSVRAQLYDYIHNLKENGRTIVFVTNSGRLEASAMAKLQAICAAVIIRRNIGYDFGAWRDALDVLSLPRPQTEEVIFANDSVFGPLAPLGDILARLDYGKADIWGLTDSWQVRYHLQSFFMAFGPVALRAEAFRLLCKSDGLPRGPAGAGRCPAICAWRHESPGGCLSTDQCRHIPRRTAGRRRPSCSA